MIQTLFDFPVYFKFFHRVICAGQPGRDYSRLYQHDQLSDSGSAKQKRTLQPTCLWPLSCGSRFFSATRFYNFLGISIDSFRIAGGILVVTIAMSMISGKLGEDKQNKQEKIRNRGA